MNKLPHPRAKLRSGQVTNRISVCEVGTVNNISEGQLEGFGFNIPPGQGLDFRRRSFAIPSVDKDVKPLLWSLDVLSGDLKEPTHLSIRVG